MTRGSNNQDCQVSLSIWPLISNIGALGEKEEDDGAKACTVGSRVKWNRSQNV
jgi:hypothetical protein